MICTEMYPLHFFCDTFFLFALMCVPYLLIMWKLVPETTGKTLEKIECYWKER